MATKEEVTFEVQVLSAGRWETQGVYKAKEQGLAMGDAKSLEKVSTIKAVRVVKESYDTQAQTSRTSTVYESQHRGEPPPAPKAPPAKPKPAKAQTPPKGKDGKRAKAKSTGASPSEDMTEAPPPLAEGGKRPSILMTFLQLVLALVFAALAAVAVTQVASMAMRTTPTIGMFTRDDFLILVFIFVFSVTALALITRILTKLRGFAPSLPKLPGAGRAEPPHRAPPMPSAAGLAAQNLHADDKMREEDERRRAEAEERLKAREEEEARLKAEAEALAKRQNEEDMLGVMVAMNAFTADALDVVTGDPENRDSHTVFGLVLFLVGAVQTFNAQRKLTDPLFREAAARTLGTLGLSKERAEHFIAHTDEYLVSNARYSQMFQAGRNAMASYLESNTGPRGALADALAEWAKPKARVESSQPVTVLFTDIAGSTAMTQKLGDAGAQEVVRAHNRIVRDAINATAGREIKHTGDGIMASFPSAAAGVEAAQDMQRKAKAHNAANPDLPLKLKIGLNAGEPISEDDDLFGTTVQLAARIVDKAAAGQILVSGSVYGLSQGKNLKFEKFGDLAMKGFDDPVTVYTALWDPDAPPVLAPAPAAAPGQAGEGGAAPAPAASPAVTAAPPKP